MKQSLEAFAAANLRATRGVSPWIETIPELDEIIAAWKAGVGGTTIRRWLVEDRGYAKELCTPGRISSYLLARDPRG